MDLLNLNKLNNETLPILDDIIEKRIEQLNEALAANIKDLTALVDRIESIIMGLNGTSLILDIPIKNRDVK